MWDGTMDGRCGIYQLRLRASTWDTAIRFRCALQNVSFPFEGAHEEPKLLASGREKNVPTFKVSRTREEPISWGNAYALLERSADLYVRELDVNILHNRPDLRNYVVDNQNRLEILGFTFSPDSTFNLRAAGDRANPKFWDEEEEERCLAERLGDLEMIWMESQLHHVRR